MELTTEIVEQMNHQQSNSAMHHFISRFGEQQSIGISASISGCLAQTETERGADTKEARSGCLGAKKWKMLM